MLGVAVLLGLCLPSAALRSPLRMTMTPVTPEKLNPRDERRRLMRSPNYNRCAYSVARLQVK